MYTPWGGIQHSTCITFGISFVSTASHGGLRVADSFAQTHLSEAARRRGIHMGECLWYEEDCAYAIPCWELETFWDKLYPGKKGSNSDIRVELRRALSNYYPDYLKEIGEEVDPEAYLIWLKHELDQTMRAMKHPDLIVSAILNRDCLEHTRVTTADGKEHVVTTLSYNDWNRRLINTLSACEIVPESA